MMTIKFRAWVSAPELESKENSVYPYMNNNIEFTGNINSIFAWNGIKQGYQVINYMQYTGLKDINGIEIYEGDIVKCEIYGKEYIGQVEFSSMLAVWFVSGMERSDTEPWGCNNKEVVGNIYENPELLND